MFKKKIFRSKKLVEVEKVTELRTFMVPAIRSEVLLEHGVPILVGVHVRVTRLQPPAHLHDMSDHVYIPCYRCCGIYTKYHADCRVLKA
jgi:hypothetical protein